MQWQHILFRRSIDAVQFPAAHRGITQIQKFRSNIYRHVSENVHVV